MKKQFLFLLVLCFCAPLLWAEDSSYQKLILVSEGDSDPFICQAVHIAPQWLLTAAHCIVPAVTARDYDLMLRPQRNCNVRIVLAQQAAAVAWASIPCQEVYFPPEIVNQKGEKVLPFDLALLHYKDGSVPYEYSPKNFPALLKKDKSLRKKWENRVPARFAPIYTLDAKTEAYPTYLFQVNSVENGKVFPVIFPASPSFEGNTQQDPTSAQAIWGVYDFGATHGDSGSGVMVRLEDGSLGLLGIVSAVSRRTVEDDPQSGEDFLFFTGFDPDVSLPFIKTLIEEDRLVPLPKPKPEDLPAQ